MIIFPSINPFILVAALVIFVYIGMAFYFTGKYSHKYPNLNWFFWPFLFFYIVGKETNDE